MREALHVIFARIRGLFDAGKSDGAFDDEAATHLELLADRFLRQGMNPEEARRAARRQFGERNQLKDSLRERRSYSAIESFAKDIHLALRQIRTAPRFTVAAAATLAFGIGATTSIFSVVNAVLLRPLPYPEADRLVWLGELHKGSSTDEVTLTPNYLDWREKNDVFTSMAAFNMAPRALYLDGGAIQLRTLKASAALLAVLEAKPQMGRAFLRSEDQKGGDPVAILSYHLWQQAYGGDKAVLGRSIHLDDGTYKVVGVLPEDFRFPTLESIDLMTPLGKNEKVELTRASETVTIVHDVIARLRSGVAMERARAEMERIEANIPPPGFLSRVSISIRVMALRDRFTGNLSIALLTLLCAVACMLLLVCANVANLLLGRSESRRREMAIRAALGASRKRIAQQLLVESLVLALLGVGMGLALAVMSRHLMIGLIPRALPGRLALPLDWRVLGVAMISGFLTAVLCGLGPALTSAKVSSSPASLTTEGRSLSGSVHRKKLLSLLAAFQTAIAIMLLAGAGLMLQSFWRLRYQDLGFSSHRIVTASLNVARSRFLTNDRQALFLDDVLDRLRNIPGVDAAGFGVLPPGEGHATNGFRIERHSFPSQTRRPVAGQYSVGAGFFRMMGIPLRMGREFEEADTGTSQPVALINQAFLRSQFPSENPIGRRLRFEANTPWRTIVGVVADVKMGGLDSAAEPGIFVPYRQSGFMGDAGLAIRTSLPLAPLAAEIRKQVAQVDSQQPVRVIETLDQRLDDAVTQPRLAAVLLGLFGLIGLLLAALGLYSVMYVLVRSHFREIGIRMALGGQSRDVVFMILGHSLRVMSVGLVAGILCAIVLSRVAHSMWWGVSAADPVTFLGSTVLLMLAGLAASALPARQASRVDPAEVLRIE
jgi:putative ABC transport system permease protein